MTVKNLMWQAEIVVGARVVTGGMRNQFVVQHELVLLALIKNLVSDC